MQRLSSMKKISAIYFSRLTYLEQNGFPRSIITFHCIHSGQQRPFYAIVYAPRSRLPSLVVSALRGSFFFRSNCLESWRYGPPLYDSLALDGGSLSSCCSVLYITEMQADLVCWVSIQHRSGSKLIRSVGGPPGPDPQASCDHVSRPILSREMWNFPIAMFLHTPAFTGLWCVYCIVYG